MTKPRKKYRPKPVFQNPLLVAMQGVRLLSSDDQVLYSLRLSDAVDAVITGQAKQDQWQQITDVLNMLDVMAEDPRIMTGAAEFVEGLQWSVTDILDRRKDGKTALYAPEVQSLRDLVSLWSDVLGDITHRQFFDVQEKVRFRVREALRNGSPKLRIVEAA